MGVPGAERAERAVREMVAGEMVTAAAAGQVVVAWVAAGLVAVARLGPTGGRVESGSLCGR